MEKHSDHGLPDPGKDKRTLLSLEEVDWVRGDEMPASIPEGPGATGYRPSIGETCLRGEGTQGGFNSNRSCSELWANVGLFLPQLQICTVQFGSPQPCGY